MIPRPLPPTPTPAPAPTPPPPQHRLGHTLGLTHAGLASSAFRPAGGAPQDDDDYNDWFSAMGNHQVPGLCYNLPQQVFLGCECDCSSEQVEMLFRGGKRYFALWELCICLFCTVLQGTTL